MSDDLQPGPNPIEPNEGSVGLVVLGSILMVISVLVMAFCGVCSGCVLIASMQGGSGIGNLVESLPVVIPIGGVPFAIALGLFFVGRAVYRNGKPAQ